MGECTKTTPARHLTVYTLKYNMNNCSIFFIIFFYEIEVHRCRPKIVQCILIMYIRNIKMRNAKDIECLLLIGEGVLSMFMNYIMYRNVCHYKNKNQSTNYL